MRDTRYDCYKMALYYREQNEKRVATQKTLKEWKKSMSKMMSVVSTFAMLHL